jgi:hypothetical protein
MVYLFSVHAIGVNSKPSSKGYQMRLTLAERSALTPVLRMKTEVDEEHSEKLTFTQGGDMPRCTPPPSSLLPFHTLLPSLLSFSPQIFMMDLLSVSYPHIRANTRQFILATRG